MILKQFNLLAMSTQAFLPVVHRPHEEDQTIVHLCEHATDLLL